VTNPGTGIWNSPFAFSVDDRVVDLAATWDKNPDFAAEYSRCVAAGDSRKFIQWLSDHLAASPGDPARPGISRQIATPAQNEIVTRRVILPSHDGRMKISVSPATDTKAGPEYFGLPFSVQAMKRLSTANASDVMFETTSLGSADTLSYGRIKLRLKFPNDRYPQAEPIIASGIEEAGDFIYVIYTDPAHIQIGFDHWFKGGTLTSPIPLDYAREHEMEISMGSLFPSTQDVVFADAQPAAVEALKNTVLVKLDGRTVLEASGGYYDCPPSLVMVGKNTIHGTTSGPQFTGRIISVDRVWPELK